MVDWEARFQARNTPWEREGLNPAFVDWFNGGYFEDGLVYVPGCGRSPELGALAARGPAIGVDLAPSAIAHQEAELAAIPDPHPASVAILHDVLTWTPGPDLGAQVDAVYEQTCLCALPPELREDYEARIAEILRPGGPLLILFMQRASDGGPPFHCGLDEMRTLFSTDRWDWTDDPPRRSDHSPGIFELGYRLIRR
ncbi:MAG: methyltransferase domain-containing protein [Alphaproteobacteria bacterium]|nr:methyltransferase domain-containing protein [Alphaproteobacteria bacterium]